MATRRYTIQPATPSEDQPGTWGCTVTSDAIPTYRVMGFFNADAAEAAAARLVALLIGEGGRGTDTDNDG